MTAKAVRERSGRILAAGEAGELAHFTLHPDRLGQTADFVIDTMRRNYPDLAIPPHARWRHFQLAGTDRWRLLAKALDAGPDEIARIRIDLAVTSVLLDAGAGAAWRYRDPVSGVLLARSEGLAIASLEAFRSGLFSSRPAEPLRVDCDGLAGSSAATLGAAFQVRPDNPLAGLGGRAALLNRLGKALAASPEVFGADDPRIGHLFDAVRRDYPGGIAAADLLAIVLAAFGSIWPARTVLGGINLGDTWRHPRAGPGTAGDPTNGLVPFHKLSQWLTYSLIEPLSEAGIAVTDIDGLTGLAEYRNGGLFIDCGVLRFRDPLAHERRFAPGDELIVEWRALTVALLDRLAVCVRERLGRSAADLSLASILEGGTWAAGRRIAGERRSGGGPPIAIESDGSVF